MTRLTILTPTKIAGIASTAATAPVIRPVASERVLERAVPTASIIYTPLEDLSGRPTAYAPHELNKEIKEPRTQPPAIAAATIGANSSTKSAA